MEKPIRVEHPGGVFVELPSRYTEVGVGIEAPFLQRIEQESEPLYLQYWKSKESLFPKLELWDKKKKCHYSLKDFNDCNNSSDLRVLYRLFPPGVKKVDDFSLGKPRIICLECGQVYKLPEFRESLRKEKILFKGEPFKYQGDVNNLSYFLIGNNQTKLSLTFALAFMDEFSAPVPEKPETLEDKIMLEASTNVIDAMMGQENTSMYGWLVKWGYAEKKYRNIYLATGKGKRKVAAYSVAKRGRDLLNNTEKFFRKSESGEEAALGLGEPIFDYVAFRVKEAKKMFQEPTLEKGKKIVAVESKGRRLELPEEMYYIDHIPEKNKQEILERQRLELEFPEPIVIDFK